MFPAHQPVLVEEAMAMLNPRAEGCYADLTLGRGGHAEQLLAQSAPSGRLIALDRDAEALDTSRARLGRFGDRATYVHADFASLQSVLETLEVSAVDGLIADLGVSSPQLDQPERGFSFRHEGPLDMRMDPSKGETALELIGRLSEPQLADILFSLGEERRSRRIAKSIRRAYDAGELHTTRDLQRAVRRAVGGSRHHRIDPSTRTFQALRIAVNQELEQLSALLDMLADVLADDGVAAIISFHSLEDRLVKRFFRDSEHLVPLTKKPIVASETERQRNPRSRSAKLRASRRLRRDRATSDRGATHER